MEEGGQHHSTPGTEPDSILTPRLDLGLSHSSSQLDSREGGSEVEGSGYEVKKIEVLSDEEIDEYMGVYREAFDPLDELSPAKQSMTDEEFRDEMTSPTVTKYVVEDAEGRVIALACMTTDTSQVPWLSPKYYQKHFPEQFERQAIYFVGTILTHPERRGEHVLGSILDQMVIDVATNRGVAAFDCCEYNVEVVGLPEMISAVGERLCDFERQELDYQRYYAYVSHGLKPQA